ncbi:MAG TPA: sigma-70 family RNA polymerase sigma factor [Gemmataceae bacterium]|nr:sigma-70 family RNA polymerase sigma factor [Gemmataceae bacterium]
MAGEPLRTFLRHLRRAVGPDGSSVSDAELLERFVSRRDEAAFEVLVWRHAGLVLGVCGRLLRQPEDIEDIFQATFLALARRAGSIGKRESLASWLYKVAYRVALRVRIRAAREAARRQRVADLPAPPPAGSNVGPDLRSLLDEEINRLPEKYRAAVVLCYLESKTTEEAARQLGCARGTVCSRLSWARRRLRGRLTRRGLALPAAGLTAVLAPSAAPAALVDATTQAAVVFASGQAAGPLTGQAVALAEGVVRAMMLSKAKVVAVVVLVLGALSLGACVCVQPVLAEKPGAEEAPALVRGSGDGVRMPAEAPAKLGLQVAEVKPRAAAKAQLLSFTGSLAIDPDHLSRVRCRCPAAEVIEVGKADGKDGSRDLRAGDKVRKGQVLAVLESSEVAAKKNDLIDALVQLKLDQKILEASQTAYDKGALPYLDYMAARRAVEADRNAVNRAERTLTIWGVPEKQLEAVRKEAGDRERKPETEKARKARLKDWSRVEVTAPEDGTLLERNVSLGEVVVDGTVNLFQIAKLDRLKVLAQASEADLPVLEALKPEQRCWTIRPIADRDAPAAEGSIDTVAVTIDPSRHTLLVTGSVDNAAGRLRAGQAVTVSIDLAPPSGEVTLPAGAIVEEGGQTFVFVQPDAKQFFYEQRRVSVVRRGGDVVHVRARLTPEEKRQGFQTLRRGDRVVTAGAAELKAILDDLKAGEDR